MWLLFYYYYIPSILSYNHTNWVSVASAVGVASTVGTSSTVGVVSSAVDTLINCVLAFRQSMFTVYLGV